jgi:hypothetical protein
MLTQLQHYLMQQGACHIQAISEHLSVEADVARDLLRRFMSKGKVQKKVAACGSGCSQCSSCFNEIYQWVFKEV